MTYRVVECSVTRKAEERVILAQVVSKPFTFRSPERNELISAEHKVLCVMGEKMDQVYFQAGRYTAMNQAGTEEGVFSVETIMVRKWESFELIGDGRRIEGVVINYLDIQGRFSYPLTCKADSLLPSSYKLLLKVRYENQPTTTSTRLRTESYPLTR